MSNCPDVETLMNNQAGAHLAGCAACRAVAALADQHRAGLHADPVDCVEVDAWLAAQLLGEVDEQREVRLRAHVISCGACLALAQEVSEPGVADAVFDLGALRTSDFADLRTVELDNYTRGAEIGRGGMGRIVRARDRRLGRAVAIKELLDDKLRARFEREARLTARLQHPAIVNIHEAGRWPSGAPFYVMKYVAGEPLERRIARTRTLAERLELLPNVITVVEALAYAHSERIIHRDLKPANILVGPFGETVVIDWGLAKDLDERVPEPSDAPYRVAAPVTTVGGIGTPQYMPPEQAEEHLADRSRLDVYALGATLYHVLSGRPPFGDVSGEAALERLLGDGLPPLGAVAPDVPEELTTIVAKAMARNPEQRYASAAELADELKRFSTGQLVSAHHYSLGDLWGRWLRKHRAPIALATVFVVLLGGVGAVSVSRVYAARRDAEQQLGELLFERGQRELADGQPSRAVVYLDAALRRGMDTPALRYLIGEASRPLLALHSVPLAGTPTFAALDGESSRAVTSYDDRPAQVWEAKTGKSIAMLGTVEQTGGLLGLGMSADGTRVYTHKLDGVRLWDVKTGALLATLTDRRVAWVGFSGDSAHIVTVFDHVASSFDASGQLEHRVTVATGNELMAVTSHGRELIGFNEEQVCQVWDLATGTLLHSIGRPLAGRITLSVGPNDRRILFTGRVGEYGPRAYIADLATGMVFDAMGSDRLVVDADFATDGRVVMVDTKGVAHTSVYQRGLERVDGPELVHASSAIRFARLGDEGQVVTIAFDGTIEVWTDGQTEPEIVRDVPGGLPLAIAVNHGRLTLITADGVLETTQLSSGYTSIGARMAFAALFDSGAHVLTFAEGVAAMWSTTTGDELISTDADLRPPAAIAPDGEHVVGTRKDGTFARWDLRSGAVETIGPALPEGETASFMTPDGERVLGIDAAQRKGTLRDPHGQTIASFDASDLDFSPDGGFVFGIVADGALVTWDARTGREQRRMHIEYAPPHAPRRRHHAEGIQFSTRGDRLVTTLSGDRVAVWDGHGLRLRELAVGPGALIMSPAGDRLMVYAQDTGFVLWNLDTGEKITTLRTRTESPFVSGDFTADGALFVAPNDDDLHIWEASTGELRATRPFPKSAAGAQLSLSTHEDAALVNWRLPLWGSGIFDLHQGPIDRAALAALAAKIPFRLDGGRLVPR